MSLVTFFAISLGLIHDEARIAMKVLSFESLRPQVLSRDYHTVRFG